MDLFDRLVAKIDEKAAQHSRLVAYYTGSQPLTHLAPEIRANLNNRLTTVSSNIPRLLVDALAERLRITGFTDPRVWPHWSRAGMATWSGTCHRESLMLGDAYALVWADKAGRPTVSVESATQVSVEVDPASREVLAGLKRWEAPDGTHAVLYGPDEIIRHHSPTAGATTGFRVVERIRNPFGRPPLVRFRNGDRLTVDGISEMSDILSLADALVKLLTDLLVASEYGARPRRWATGLELTEDDEGNVANPIGESDKMMVNEAPEGKFGQLPGSDLGGYESAIGVIMRQISAVSGLPEHALGIGGEANPTSADAIRASEASLTARAEARQHQFGRAWSEVAALILAVETGQDPASFDVAPIWADAGTRSIAQEADAITKLHAQGLITTDEARAKLGIQ